MNKHKLIEALQIALDELTKPTITFTPPKLELIDLNMVDEHLRKCDLSEDYRNGYSDGIVFAEREHGIRGKNE